MCSRSMKGSNAAMQATLWDGCAHEEAGLIYIKEFKVTPFCKFKFKFEFEFEFDPSPEVKGRGPRGCEFDLMRSRVEVEW